MSSLRLSPQEISAAFDTDALRQQFPSVLGVPQVARLLNLSSKTIYDWIAKGRLNGSFRKRGKHLLFWRDRVLDRVFNGPEWSPTTHE